TSQPSTGEVRHALESLRAGGAEQIVAITLSSQLSGTCDAVRAASEAFRAETGIPVLVVDTRSIGAATGFAVLAAWRAVEAGQSAAEVAATASRVALSSRAWVTVSDLRHLQRGGRLKASHALIGTALGVRPLLRIDDGALVATESVRGAARARRRLVELVVEGALEQVRSPGGQLDVAVHHTGDDLGAAVVADELRGAAAEANLPVRSFLQGRISPVLAVHGGPGALSVVTSVSG
nr:DegV family protein [Actinomycetales bacterium]